MVVTTHCSSENKGSPGLGYSVWVEYEVHAVFVTVVGKDVAVDGTMASGVGVPPVGIINAENKTIMLMEGIS